MKPKWVIIVLCIFLLTCSAILSVYQHKANESIFLSYFQEHQLLHAQHLAEQIETLLWAHRRILETFPSYASNPRENMELLKRNIQTYSRQMKEDYTDKIFLYDKKGIMLYSTDSKGIGLSQGQRPFFLWAQKKENRGRLFISPLLTREENWQAQMQPKSSDRKDISPDEFKIFLALPLYHRSSSEKSGQWDWEFIGVLSFLIDLKKFLTNELKDYKLSEHRIWIIDRDSTVLFHSGHPEMKFRNIHQRDETCMQCHISFNYIDEISEKGEGTAEYTVKTLPRKLAGFSSVKFADISWVVVVNSTYDDASASIRKSLRHSLLLLGTVVLSFLLVSAYLIWNERMEVRAQEEAKHWREKRALEDEMQQSEVLYEAIIETAHDAIGVLDTEGNFIFLNKTGEEISGYELSELAGKNFAHLIHPKDLPRVKNLFLRSLEGKSYDADFEVRICAKDGNIRLLSLNSVPLYRNGKVIGLSSIGRDITEYRKAENALRESEKQLRYLSSQLLTTQETERRRISKELHDELGQMLALLKLRLDLVEKHLPKDQVGLGEEYGHILQDVDKIIESVRNLARNLSPYVLEYFGITIALQRLINDFVKSNGMKVALDIFSMDHLFSKDAQMTIYRIFQEALRNITKYAGATHLSVVVSQQEDKVSFLIEDNGKGFDVKQMAMKDPTKKGLGLLIMEERAQILGGSFDLWSQEGKGTRLSFAIPIALTLPLSPPGRGEG